MSNPFAAMTWELWRISRWEVFARVAGPTLIWPLILNWVGNDGPRTQFGRGIVLLLLAQTSIFSSSWLSRLDSMDGAFTFRLGFTRPVTTWALVATPMLYIASTTAICYAVPASACRFFVDRGFPVFGPASIALCAVTCLVAASWSVRNFIGRILAVVAVLAAGVSAAAAFASQQAASVPLILTIGSDGFLTLSWTEHALLWSIAAVAVTITVVSVDRQRHGDSLRIGSWGRLSSRPRIAPRWSRRPFSGPVAAQFWFEMRRSGNRVIWTAIVAAVVAAVVISCLHLLRTPLHGKAIGLWLVALAISHFVFQMLGAHWAIGLTHRQGDISLSSFDATQGMRNDDMITIKVLVVATSTLVGWLVVLAAAMVQTFCVGASPGWAELVDSTIPMIRGISPLGWVVGVASFAFLYWSATLGMIALGLLMPVLKIFSCISMIAYATAMLALIDFKEENWSLEAMWVALGWLTAVGLAAALVMSLAVGRKILRARLMAGSVIGWSVFASLAVFVYVNYLGTYVNLSVSAHIQALVSLTIPLTISAAAPLALALHRHR